MKRLVIIGASGHVLIVADIEKKNGYTNIVYLDDDSNKTKCEGYSMTEKSCVTEKMDEDLFTPIRALSIPKRVMDSSGRCVTLIYSDEVRRIA